MLEKRIIEFLIRAKRATYAGKGAETHSMREMFFAAGRVLGVLFFMLMPDTPAGQVTALLLLLLTQLVPGYFVSVTQKELKI